MGTMDDGIGDAEFLDVLIPVNVPSEPEPNIVP